MTLIQNALSSRYPDVYLCNTKLDQFSDVVVLTRYLATRSYLHDLLVRVHGLSAQEARTRTKKIIPHIETALDYVAQAEDGPNHLAFLPGYYAMLNLLKAMILVGQHHADLPNNRWHGASYDGLAKDSQGVLTEEIKLHARGAIPLFYRTITGLALTRTQRIKMADMYPYLTDISVEYELATGNKSRLFAYVAAEQAAQGTVTPVLRIDQASPNPKRLSDLKAFPRLTQDPGDQTVLRLPTVAAPATVAAVQSTFRPFLLYHPFRIGDVWIGITPISRRRLLLPEELPICLLFFHMSSVVRYKPEFLAQIQDSKEWPMLLTASRHCLFKMLLLSWSYFHRRTLMMRAN
jgi:hypothetical protein